MEDFIEEAKLYVSDRGLGKEEEARLVFSHLSGEAKREVRTCGRSWDCTNELFQILTKAFGEVRTVPALFSLFAERRQLQRETIRSYSSDLYERHSAVVRRQRQTGRLTTAEEVLVDYFVDGLQNRNLAVELRRHMTKSALSFARAREIALEWELVQRPVSRKPSEELPFQQEPVSSFSAGQDALQEANSKLQAEVAKLKQALAQQTEAPGRSAWGDRKLRCFLCKELGHIKRNCPHKQSRPDRPPLNA